MIERTYDTKNKILDPEFEEIVKNEIELSKQVEIENPDNLVILSSDSVCLTVCPYTLVLVPFFSSIRLLLGLLLTILFRHKRILLSISFSNIILLFGPLSCSDMKE